MLNCKIAITQNAQYWSTDSTEHAYLESDDGAIIKAAPGIYFPDLHDRSKPGRFIGTGLVDVNSDEIQLKNTASNSFYGRFYIKLNAKHLKKDAQWRLHLGSVLINGQSVTLSPRDICTREGSSTWMRSRFNP